MDDRLKHAEGLSKKARDFRGHRRAGNTFLKICESAKSDEEANDYVGKAKAHYGKACPTALWANRKQS